MEQFLAEKDIVKMLQKEAFPDVLENVQVMGSIWIMPYDSKAKMKLCECVNGLVQFLFMLTVTNPCHLHSFLCFFRVDWTVISTNETYFISKFELL